MPRQDWHLPSDLASVTAARHRLREQMDAWGCDDDLVEDAALVVSELVANAVRHGVGDVVLSATLGRQGLELGVSDADGEPIAPRPAAAKHVENGRGLAIVAALSRRWGVEILPEGKRVWCLLGDDQEQPAAGDAIAVRLMHRASA